jgi:glycerophosphoryl diester phosphodiesterase
LKVIAHRGASGDAPENTLAAIKLAWELNADGVEIDLRLSADNCPILFHDADLQRIAGVNLSIRHQTLESLRQYDVGQWKDPKWKGEKIPTLDTVISAIPNDKILLLELKEGPELIPAIERTFMSASVNMNNLWFMSFDLSTVSQVKSMHSNWQTLLLVGNPRSDSLRELNSKIVDAKNVRANGLGLANAWFDTLQLIPSINYSQLLLSVWTVNDTVEAQNWASIGAKMITTDFPDQISTSLR